MRYLSIAVALISAVPVLQADNLITINFDTTPSLPAGPILYQDAGAAVTVTVPGAATIGGGVVLGVPASLEGVANVSAPNIYGTASDNVVVTGGLGLGSTISIGIPASFVANQATVPVINGMSDPASYYVTAFAGSTQISQQLLSNVPAFNSAVASFTVPGITGLTITPADSARWDFATDGIALLESADSAPPDSDAPEPASLGLAIAGILGMTLYSGARRRGAGRG